MPRRPRSEEAGAIHHVYARGVRSAALFLDEDDRRRYLRLLGRATRQEGWRCLSFCLMTNHVHILVETPEANLGTGMSRLHGDYASGFNERHGTVGHVFQGRYGSVRIKDDAHLLTVVRYLDRNPLAAGLVARPDDWPWCSSAALRGQTGPPWLAIPRLLSLLPDGWIELDQPKGAWPL